jgi:ParB family chromosome partitioning protein
MISLVPLDEITPNPWQPRQNMDPAGINELALSIARDDLMQVPVARKDPTTAGIYQLAIGHRRLEAFATLETIAGLITDRPDPSEPDALWIATAKAIGSGRTFHEIPLEIKDLTDQQMFEMAIQENLQRKDLNPIEQALHGRIQGQQ